MCNSEQQSEPLPACVGLYKTSVPQDEIKPLEWVAVVKVRRGRYREGYSVIYVFSFHIVLLGIRTLGRGKPRSVALK